MDKKNKIILWIVFLALGVLCISSLINRYRFSVSYIICDTAYANCFTQAKFKDMDSCQTAVEKGNWLCDEGNPNDIRCKVSTNSIAKAYCKD